jgi:hypothetical protein
MKMNGICACQYGVFVPCSSRFWTPRDQKHYSVVLYDFVGNIMHEIPYDREPMDVQITEAGHVLILTTDCIDIWM